jgi:hypothetical protein
MTKYISDEHYIFDGYQDENLSEIRDVLTRRPPGNISMRMGAYGKPYAFMFVEYANLVATIRFFWCNIVQVVIDVEDDIAYVWIGWGKK